MKKETNINYGSSQRSTVKKIKDKLHDWGFTPTPTSASLRFLKSTVSKIMFHDKNKNDTQSVRAVKTIPMLVWGFTLIELLIVVAIVGILSSVVVMNLSTAREKARDTQRVANVSQIANAIAIYQIDSGGVPPGEDGVEYVNGNPEWIPGLVPKYMSSVPSDPIDVDEHKFHYSRQGNDYEVISFLEQSGNDAACGDGGNSCQYYEKASGEFLALANPGASGWRFASSTEVVVVLPPSPQTTLTAPAGFSMSSALPGTNLYSGYLSFSWTTQNDVAGYRIYLTNTATNVTTTLNFSPANQSGVGNFGYAQGVQYSAYIVSVDADGNISAPSTTLYATTLKLTSPTNFTASATSPTSASLAWTASEGIIYKYMITRYTGSVGNAQKIVEVLAPATSYIDTTVEPGVTYIYWIKAMSLENYAGFNVGVPVTTPAS
ncbi:MAG: General secretion pathway protein G [Parcubacteria group bacterium GW2011_GWA1_47_8]|uniref:General secretion pathway protein G n=1 Tax=Candidatus Giovannonibacteria bacterium GW2011_GWA2_45_21 TaxID=1618649 RepID=A0A0G1Q5L8_9BACT|nr:MAG: General secretion pathway protein G [Candidatus Giovannonibacteria bacterium GW2011_GWA2_45_21]KKU80052.1 MAG: General secretion pathway protein G [Parcubacteria group bacterium GW2011_GWA1_47_8]